MKNIVMKRIIAMLLSVGMMFGITAYAEEYREEAKKTRYIVMLEEPALYSEERPAFFNGETDEYKNGLREYLRELQSNIKAQIPGISTFSLRTSQEEYSFTDVINGFTITCDYETKKFIETIDGVKGVYEDKLLSVVEPETLNEETAGGIASASDTDTSYTVADINGKKMIAADYAYEQGYNGKGRAVAIIDSTIIPEHIYFNVKDETAVKYSKTDIADILTTEEMNIAATAVEAYRNAKIPFAYNYAANSASFTATNTHGVHVAGIAAGGEVSIFDGVLSGIAPEAQILFFAVGEAEGGVKTSNMIRALEDVSKFDVDAVNLSLGSDYFSEFNGVGPMNEAVKSIRNRGTSVIFAAGNSDKASLDVASPDYSTSDNENYLYSTKVGSVQSDCAYKYYITDDKGDKYPCVVLGTETAMEALELVDCGSGTAEEIKAANVTGKAALISMPDQYILNKSVQYYADAAKEAGAAAVVVVSYQDYLSYSGTSLLYPAFYITKSSYEKISSAETVAFPATEDFIKMSDSTVASAFSSYGSSDMLDITVDFSAPGGDVLSARSGKNAFAYNSGTSMAAPQVAGASVLMSQYVEEKFPEYTKVNKVMLIKNLLTSTAETVYEKNGAISSVRKVGSGLMKIDRAMTTAVVLKDKTTGETKLNCGAGTEKAFDVTFTAYNLGDEDVTFNEVSLEMSSDDYKNYGNRGYGCCGIRKLTSQFVGADEVVVPAGESKDVTLSVMLSDSHIAYLETVMVNGFFIDGKITLSSSAENCDVGIPFTRFYGDWAAQPIISSDETAKKFKVLAMDEEANFYIPMLAATEGDKLVLPISENPDTSAINLPVRACVNTDRNAFMTVWVDGELMFKDSFVNKKYLCGYFMKEMLVNDVTPGSVIKVELRLPYDTEGKNKYIFEVETVADNEKADITQIYVNNESGKNYVYFTAKDNYNVSVVSRWGITADELAIISDYYIEAKSGTAKFTTDGFTDIFYQVYDGALNLTELYPEISIDVKEGTAIFTNNTHNGLTGMCILATYTENNCLKEMILLGGNSELSFNAYESKTFDVSSYSNEKYKLFFWENLERVTPLCDEYAN